jgi:hypothetical protein
MIGYLLGGILGYSGELRDSTEFKPISERRRPHTPEHSRKNSTARRKVTNCHGIRRFPLHVTLQGRLAGGDMSNGRCAPLLILNGRGGNSAVTINGLNRTIRGR